MKRTKKATILAVTYGLAAIVTLGACAWVNNAGLADYRLAAKYSAGRAFEETVRSVDGLSQALAKSVYATDGGMCGRICGEAYANALAAEAALSTLPFSTQELEQISAFLNVAGDYAYTLSGQAAEAGFTQEQLETLTDLSHRAAEMAGTLEELRGGVNGGSVIIDSREKRLQNVGEETGTEKLSARLLAYEQSLQPSEQLEYDGMYGVAPEEPALGGLSESEQRTRAAACAGVEADELEDAYEYQGAGDRRCYRAGDTLITVGPEGVESLAQSRLVSECRLDPEQAPDIALRYLAKLGCSGLELTGSQVNGAVCAMDFCQVQDGAACLDNCVRVSVALDDGSIYGFDLSDYSAEGSDAAFELTEEEAAQALPQGLEPEETRKVVIKSAGERDQGCYEFTCPAGEEGTVKIYVDAVSGKQDRIELSA